MYKVVIEKEAVKYLNRLDRPTVKRLRNAIDQIGEDPTVGERLSNHDATYKYRVGSYRILYDVYENEVVVVVVKIASRGQFYRK